MTPLPPSPVQMDMGCHMPNNQPQPKKPPRFTKPPPIPEVYIDGPYSTPLSNYNRYKLSILVSNGSGLSPFLSILRSRIIRSNSENPYEGYINSKPWDRGSGRLVFVWVIRHWEWLSWIQDDLEDLLHLAAEPSQNLQLVVFITGGEAPDHVRSSLSMFMNSSAHRNLPRSVGRCVDIFHTEYTQ